MSKKAKSNILKDNLEYIEAVLLYVVIILAIYLSIYGMLLVKLIPLLFIVGFFGRVIYDRPVVISLIGLATSLCIIQMFGGYDLQYNLFYSLYTFMCMIVGAMSGKYVLNIYHSRAKKVTVKVAHNISFSILTIFIGIFFNVYMNGDLVAYIKARNVLNSYIQTVYPEYAEDVKITKATYLSGDLNYYSFTVTNLASGTYKMGVYLDSKVVDGYSSSRIKSMSALLRSKFKFKYGDSLIENADVSVYYTDSYKNITLKCVKNIDGVSDIEIEEYIQEVSNLIKNIEDFDEFDNISKVIMQIKSRDEVVSAEISKDDFFDVDKYKEKFNVEVFDV
ncbi:MAG: hypothetical protein IJ809_00255 [Clostridia bacterium]|nr:hypothetical protein [Clostridia bacterium]